MNLITVGAVSINQTPLAIRANLQRIMDAIREAQDKDVQILCLPELCITGYGCEDAFHMPSLQQAAMSAVTGLAESVWTKDIVVTVGLPVMYRNALFNCVAVIANQQLLGFVAKQHLAGDGIHYEPRWFKPWPSGERGYVNVGGEDIPIGDLQFEIGGVRIGFEVCEDAWVADRPGTALARKAVDVILNPSASHFAFGKFEIRKRFVIEGSRAFGVTYVYSNLLGNEAGRVIYDGGALIATRGDLVAQGSRFSYKDFEVTTAVIDVDATRTIQCRTASFRPTFEPTEWVTSSYRLMESALYRPKPQDVPVVGLWERDVDHIKEQEFTHAIALGLFDYLRKSRSKGFVVSLSGGADSAACAVLVYTMARLARRNLGTVQEVCKRLGLEPAEAFDDLMGRLLTCVYQSTRNSSETTLIAAMQVSKAIASEFFVLHVDDVVQRYTEMAENALSRSLDWKNQNDDLALQNIQARVRAPSVWLIANLKNALLLSTSNRSEAAVGYCTMDGDTAGSISPIAGIDKQFLRRWLRWMSNESATHTQMWDFAPVPALSYVNNQQPTAELRPQAENQTDEKDLMPYDVLDAIEKAMIRDKKSPADTYLTVRYAFSEHKASDIGIWVERFVRLWCRNQWKRERYAPSFHVDDENLDPRSWCRFPILSDMDDALDQLRFFVKRDAPV